MSSPARRLQLKLLRAAGKLPRRHKAIAKFKGYPYRNCLITKRDPVTGAVLAWKRYH